MPALLLKDIPEKVSRELKKQAIDEGKGYHAFLREMLSDKAGAEKAELKTENKKDGK